MLLAQRRFCPAHKAGPQKVFRSSAAAELAVFAPANTAQTPSPSQDRQCFRIDLGIPSLLKLLLLKSTFARNHCQAHLIKYASVSFAGGQL